MENRIWFTADLHFGHDKEFMYAPRGFKSVKEHDEMIIKYWNTVVEPDDEVWVLGDLMLNDNKHGIECINKLNGKLHIIVGNHDTDERKEIYKTLPNVISVDYAYELKVGKYYFWLSHYPTITANFDDGKPWAKHLINLYGHTHQQEKFYNDNPYMYNVGLDAHSNCPILLDNIIQDIVDKKSELVRKQNDERK